MNMKPDGERLVSLEVETKNIVDKVNNVENSIQSLHGKIDNLTKVLAENYVAKDTFEQYKKTQIEKDKNKNIERALWILITAAITGLIAFFLREIKF